METVSEQQSLEQGKTRHTPGPWKVVQRHLSRTKDGEAYAVIQTTGAAIDIIAPCSMDQAHMANANLIAAAPDLLACAKAAATGLWLFIATIDDSPIRKELSVTHAALNAAISKAEGRSL